MQLLDDKERTGSLLILAFALVYLRHALELPVDTVAGDESFSARTLPLGLAAAAILVSFAQLVAGAVKGGGERISDSVRAYRWAPAALLVLSMGIYSLVFEWLGFMVASFLFLQCGFLILGERRILLSASIAAALVLALWLLLTQVFGLYLDSGDLFRLFSGSAP